MRSCADHDCSFAVVRALVLPAVCLVVTAGCRSERAVKPGAEAPAPAIEAAQVVKKVSVKGFDPAGEPEIQQMSDGSLRVVFEFMPPSYIEERGTELGPFKAFDRELERAAGVPVVREDREVFLIRESRAETLAKVRRFLETYRKRR